MFLIAVLGYTANLGRLFENFSSQSINDVVKSIGHSKVQRRSKNQFGTLTTSIQN